MRRLVGGDLLLLASAGIVLHGAAGEGNVGVGVVKGAALELLCQTGICLAWKATSALGCIRTDLYHIPVAHLSKGEHLCQQLSS